MFISLFHFCEVGLSSQWRQKHLQVTVGSPLQLKHGRRRALTNSAAGREADYGEETGGHFRCEVVLLILIYALKWQEALEHTLGAASKHLPRDVTPCTQ